MCGKKACGGKKKRRHADLPVKRLIKEQRQDHARENAEEKILRKDQHPHRAHAAWRREFPEQWQFFLPQAGRGPSSGQDPCQAQTVIDRAQQNARKEGPKIQQSDCRLGKIHTASQ